MDVPEHGWCYARRMVSFPATAIGHYIFPITRGVSRGWLHAKTEYI